MTQFAKALSALGVTAGVAFAATPSALASTDTILYVTNPAGQVAAHAYIHASQVAVCDDLADGDTPVLQIYWSGGTRAAWAGAGPGVCASYDVTLPAGTLHQARLCLGDAGTFATCGPGTSVTA